MDAKKNGASQAYPVPAAFNPLQAGDFSCQEVGLTKREAFAMAAMQGLLASGAKTKGHALILDDLPSMMAPEFCVLWADAMLAELAKE